MTSPDLVQCYRSMAGVSRRMVEAAKANDWDLLLAHNGDLVGLRERIAASSGDGIRLSPPERDEVISLITEMQDHDRLIREITGPLRDSLRELLSRKDRSLDLHRAYGSFRQQP